MSTRALTTAIAWATLGLSHAAQAQSEPAPCVEQPDIADASVFVMPVMLETLQSRCSAELSATGYLAREGSGLIERYRAMRDQTWPGTLRFFETFANNELAKSNNAPIAEIGNLFGEASDDIMQMMVTEVIRTKLAPEIKTKDCGRIERLLEILDPLPPENVGGAVALIMDMVQPENPSVCPFEEN